jgi:hypothetical protein
MDELTRARRRKEGRILNAPAPTRFRWRELDSIQDKRDTEPESWPFQCFCSYRYDSKSVLLRHATHANKYSPDPTFHRPFIARKAL